MDQAIFNSLKSSCDDKKRARVQAQSFRDSAESAWSTRRAACKKLASQRQLSMCALGTKAKAEAHQRQCHSVEGNHHAGEGRCRLSGRHGAEWKASQMHAVFDKI